MNYNKNDSDDNNNDSNNNSNNDKNDNDNNNNDNNDICILCLFSACLVIERPADIEEGFALNAPLVYHYGHNSPNDNLPLYEMLISRIAEVVNLRCEGNKRGKY